MVTSGCEFHVLKSKLTFACFAHMWSFEGLKHAQELVQRPPGAVVFVAFACPRRNIRCYLCLCQKKSSSTWIQEFMPCIRQARVGNPSFPVACPDMRAHGFEFAGDVLKSLGRNVNYVCQRVPFEFRSHSP